MRLRRWRGLGMALALLLPLAATAETNSFRSVRNRVFAQPLEHKPLLYFPEPRIALATVNGKLQERLARTLEQPTDFKAPVKKLVHALGVCAEGVWQIDAPSPATGLLAEGTKVPALLRFSVGSNRTVWTPPIPRNFGMALKLFPTRDLDEPVFSRNLFVFDQYGMNGHLRRGFFDQLPLGAELFFTNVAFGSLPHAWGAFGLLRAFAPGPMVRPLYPFTTVTDGNARVEHPVTPHQINFVPRVEQLPDTDAWDFRDGLMSYRPGELVFDIVLPRQDGIPRSMKIGTLTVGRMVMSKVCDQSLHFFHHPWVDAAHAEPAEQDTQPMVFP